MHITATSTVTTIFTTTTSNATIYKAKSIEIKFQDVCEHTIYQKEISTML